MIELVGVRLDHPHDGAPLVRRADVAVGEGEVVVIAGTAGIGTSRLVAALLGEAAVTEGTIAVLGRDIAKLRRAALRVLRRQIGVVPQDLCLLGDRTALLNVVIPLEIDGVPRATTLARAAAALERLGLDGHGELLVEQMAWSARQRVAIARALVRDPKVIVADQPTSLQDETGARLVCQELAAAAEKGAAVLALGRDPLLQKEARRRGWKLMTLEDGYLSDRVPETIDLDDFSLDLVIESVSVPVKIAGAAIDIAIAPAPAAASAPLTVTEPSAPAAACEAIVAMMSKPALSEVEGSSAADAPALSGPAPKLAAGPDEEGDSDGVPNHFLPFGVSARSAAGA